MLGSLIAAFVFVIFQWSRLFMPALFPINEGKYFANKQQTTCRGFVRCIKRLAGISHLDNTKQDWENAIEGQAAESTYRQSYLVL